MGIKGRESTMGTEVAAPPVERGPAAATVVLTVNGQRHEVRLEPRVSLLDALREHLGLTGSKKGCDQGTCGACTMWVDGRRVLACLTLAVACEDREVTTIEGLSSGGDLHPMQAAFVERDAFQCGYCTPGQIMSAVALLEEGHAGDDAEIADWMSGNICRCAAYPNIRAAIRDVRDAAGDERYCGPSATPAPPTPVRLSQPSGSARTARSWPGEPPRSTWCARTCCGRGCSWTLTTCRSMASRRAPGVRERFPVISQALVLGASPQLRNMASMGGNLCQRVRCSYFRDPASPCNKRDPGSGCAALEGFNRGHAILGTSDKCIATHPSDVAVALVALDAVVHTRGPTGERAIGIDDFFLLPGDTPEREHPLEHGELITAIEVPAAPVARRSVYLKFRDRESYEFALASVAAAVRIEDGSVAEVRLALGGVGTKPWRARRAEASLLGQPAASASFAEAARQELAMAAARPLNAFKVELAQRAIVRALTTLTDGEA
jgi:xanthine dehydrogenase YagS FAD-binding subunit